MGVLQLLAADETTVLWDFDDATGAANLGTVVTKLGGALDLGTLGTDVNIFRTGEPGGQKLGVSDPPVEFTVEMMASAASYDALVLGLGQLARWLRDPPGPLKWTQGAAARYMDLLGTPTLPALFRGQGMAGLVPLRSSSMGPIPISILRQPWMREAPITTASDTVANDPITDNRVFAVTISGDLPTPARIRAQMDAASQVERVLVGWRAQGAEPASVMADYLSDTGWAQLEATGRGWTVALGTGTASSADADASGGNAARITTSLTDRLRRSRLTRTTKLDSLRGAWDVWGRFKSWGAALWNVELRWGPSLADPPGFSEDPVELDTSSLGTPPAFGYVEVKLGRIYFPEDVTFTGATLEWWAQRMSGVGDLSGDHLWLVPADDNATIMVPPTGPSVWLGKDLATPPYKTTTDPVWTNGSIVGDFLRINAVNEGAGTPPNTGLIWGAGRHIVTILTTVDTFASTIKWRVVNVTDDTEVISETLSSDFLGQRTTTFRFDGVAGKAYQPQVVFTAHTPVAKVDIREMRHSVLPSLTSGESFRTEPGPRYAIDRLDSSANLTGYLGVEGEIPAMLEPGLNHLMFRGDEVPLALYPQGENKKARTMTVTVVHSPRYAL